MPKRKAATKAVTFEERVKLRAYQLSQEDPSRSPDENWRLAERQLMAPCQPSLPCFLLVVVLALLVFLAFGLIYQTMLRNGEASWPFNVFYYVLVAAVALFLVHVVAESKALQQGILWPFTGLVTAFQREGKTFWDFLELIGGAALLGLIVSVISFFVTQSNHSAQKSLQEQRENQQLLVDYVQDVTNLLDGENRDYEKLNDDLRVSISTRTLNTIQALSGDPLRQGDAIRFASRVTPRTICESGKVDTQGPCFIPDNIPVAGVTLRNFHIDHKGEIPREFFEGVDLSWSNFEGSDFEVAFLNKTKLIGADLSRTRFSKEVQLLDADFSLADLSNAQFNNVNLKGARGLESAKYDNTTFTLESALSTKIPGMCLYVRTRRVFIDEAFIDPAAKTSVADEKNKLFRKEYGCDPIPGPNSQSWHVRVLQSLDMFRLSLLDLRWWVQRRIRIH